VRRLLALRREGNLTTGQVRSAADVLGVRERAVWRWLAAAEQAQVQAALVLWRAALLVTHAPGTWTDAAVRGHARTLLDATAALPVAERPAAWQGLRRALVNAGDVAARHQ
jgi:hypothetical protein